MTFPVRTATDADWDEVWRIDRTVFGGSSDPAHSDAEQRVLPIERVLVAEDPHDGIVGTAGDYPFELTLPGGVAASAAGVTNVGVLPTHRRRGILRSLMDRQLDDIAARGEPLAMLNASEAPIYGRFGYGLATRYAVWRLDNRAVGAALRAGADTHRLRLVDRSVAAEPLADIYERARLRRPGTVARTDEWWTMLLGDAEMWKGGGEHTVVVSHPLDAGDAGDGGDATAGSRAPDGYALYRLHHDGPNGWFRLVVRELVATNADAARALWCYLCEVDLVGAVDAEVAVDEPLYWQVPDPRRIRTRELRDFLFVRVLDAPAALAARRYARPVELVLDVEDRSRPTGAAAGRFRLGGAPDGAECQAVGDEVAPDLRLDVTALGSLLLGGVRPSWLAAAGTLVELRPGALVAAEAFCSDPEPFCVTRF
ncbi:MAG: GNAT family N-acetyltransferase [Acidimicrobiia bacterium]|nr:GNAT family N-acetyltransferase [Acidimicrobiia bacterium]